MLQGLAAGFGLDLAWVWPGIGQGLAAGIGFRDWLQSCRVAGLQGCRVVGLQLKI